MFLNVIGPINALGYGVATFNVIKAAHRIGHRINYFPITTLRDDDVRPYKEDLGIIRMVMENAKMYTPYAPTVRIWHQNQLDLFVGAGERVGWPIFELNRFTEQELHHLNNVDKLVVCSQWAKGVCEENDVGPPISVVPLGVDPKVFFIDKNATLARPWHARDKTVFINVGKWEVRKGHDVLIDAFCKAFTEDDKVELWMMNDNPFIGTKGNEQWKLKYLSSKLGGKIKFKPRVESPHQLRELYNQVDWGVFPSRAEGWNLEILELMACGKPCVATNYSGHTEYLDNENSLLIEPTNMCGAEDGVWFNGQGEWCDFSIGDLVERMREAHKLKQSKPTEYDKLSSACVRTSNRFTWDNTVNELIKAL